MKWTGNIKDFIITGDLHGDFQSIKELFDGGYDKESYALIILGDAGFNYYLNKTDRKGKERVQSWGCLIYCVRGNHEERPEYLPNIKEAYDEIVNGYVYYEELYPNIRYFKDGSIYNLNGYSTLVIGGAYSIDKAYRLAQAKAKGYNIDEWCGWFKGEQLTEEERKQISKDTKDLVIDFVLSHTCPYSWQPYDLFLSQINQVDVDKTMEEWLETIKDQIVVNKAWLFGHFHDDRIVRPHAEMYYVKSETLDYIAKRWEDWDNGYKLDWWLKLDPTWYFWGEEQNKRKFKDDASPFGRISQ